FFGREREIQELVRLLQPQGGNGATEQGRVNQPGLSSGSPLPLCAPARLITLSGPGGSGKSRLALQAALDLSAAYGGAAWFVSLAELSDPRLLVDAILASLRIARSPEIDPLEQV